MTLYFTVTTDLSYDQRMIRICRSMAAAGYEVVLVGRCRKKSVPLTQQNFKQKRLNCFFEKGKFFYAEYNFRLFFFLLLKKMDCICAIDLDSILPCLFISQLKKIRRVYDAHELFCEMEEIVTRPGIYKVWKKIEHFTVPKFKNAYTVNNLIAAEFNKMYGIDCQVIRNIALLSNTAPQPDAEKFILYQGAVNEGRSFETLIPAMKWVNCKLIICGNGNFMDAALRLTKENAVENKVVFKGVIKPDELRLITARAYIGITLFSDTGLSNYYSLANRFFDYIHAGIPQLCSDYPEYRSINEQTEVALLVKDHSPENLARQLNNLLDNEVVYKRLQANCLQAQRVYNWQEEEKKLLNFYNTVFASK